jgi:ABC-type microcin C transport system permease subunit YejB
MRKRIMLVVLGIVIILAVLFLLIQIVPIGPQPTNPPVHKRAPSPSALVSTATVMKRSGLGTGILRRFLGC